MKIIIPFLSLILFSHLIYANDESIVFLPAGWQLHDEQTSDARITQIYTPKKPLTNEIEEQLFIHTLVAKNTIEPQKKLEQLRADRQAQCDFFSFTEIPVMGADPAPAVGQVLYCGQDHETSQGVISMQRVTQGEHNLYLIEKRWTTYPFDHPETAFVVREELMPWIKQMTRAFISQPAAENKK